MPHLKIYRSSAGSGKTFTLVKEYLHICLPDPDRFRRVVAITFTNAAASEMKERILLRLRGLAEGRETDLANALLDDGLPPQYLANAGRLLENILYHYSWFSIGTIDSFFQRILRAFSKELNLPMDFDIFLDSEEALDYAVDNFLYRSHNNSGIHQLLVSFIREKISNGQSWGIRPDLYRIAQELLKDNSLQAQGADLEKVKDFIKELRSLISGFEEEMHRLGTEALEGMNDLGVGIDDFKYGRGGPAGHFYNVLKDRKKYPPGIRFTKGVHDSSEWLKKGASRRAEEAVEILLMELASKVYELYVGNYTQYITAKEVIKSIYTFAVYEEISSILDEYRQSKDVVLISDFTRILAKHLQQEDISFIYAKIGSRFDHFLIDEFQDTSTLQWVSLRPLVENAVSSGSACLVVGDAKQAIYRWRGGEVELIEKHLSERDFPHHCHTLSLSRNFRSGSTVISFNNLFFKGIERLFQGEIEEFRLLQQIFTDVEQQVGLTAARKGYVQVDLLQKEGRKENFREKARDIMLGTLRKLQAEGFSFKDISVLVRDRKDASEIARFLHTNKIPFITQDSLYLDHSPAVRLLLSLLFYLNDPRDDLSRTQVTFLYLRYFGPQSDILHIPLNDIFLDFTVKENGLYNKTLPEEFTGRIFELSTLSVYELVEELVRIFCLNTEPDAYIQRFQDAVLEYTQTENYGIKGFLTWWERGDFTVVLPQDQDAVQIMTIHKSKGLEYPVVLMPYAAWDFSSNKANILWVEPHEEPYSRFQRLPVLQSAGLRESLFAEDCQREDALTAIDNLNLLYVAFTRARERLYITSQLSPIKESGINNIGQVITAVLAPDQSDTDINLTYGEEMPYDIPLGEREQAGRFRILPEYPATDWRRSISLENPGLGEVIDFSTEDIVLDEKALGHISFLQQDLFGEVNDPHSMIFSPSAQPVQLPSLIIPGFGTFRPGLAAEDEDTIFLVVEFHKDKLKLANGIQAYVTFLSTQSHKKIKTFVEIPSRRGMKEIVL